MQVQWIIVGALLALVVGLLYRRYVRKRELDALRKLQRMRIEREMRRRNDK